MRRTSRWRRVDMKIKLKRKLWFYPHRCPDCGEVLVFTEHYDQVRCRKCGKKQQRRNKAARLGISLNKMRKHRWSHYGQSRYNSIRKECLEIGYCQLCGTTENLTCHHVGGGRNIIHAYVKTATNSMKATPTGGSTCACN